MKNTQTQFLAIVPKNEKHWHELRAQDVTSTDVSALFGVSPYLSLFELWHRKRDHMVVEIEPTERMKWGTRLQDSIAAGIAEDQGWKIRRMNEYMRDPALRMGASFDFAVDGDKDGQYVDPDQTGGLLEIKNVDAIAFKEGWAVEGDDLEAPAHIELQVQHQLAVSGRAFAYLGALVGGNRVVLIKREPDEKIISSIRETVAGFWESIKVGNVPTPNFSRDAGFISRLYSYAEPGKVFDASSDRKISSLAVQYRDLGIQEKAAKAQRDAVKAEILSLIGDAEKVRGEGFSISAGVVGPARVEYDRDPYRDFRMFWRKTKEAK